MSNQLAGAFYACHMEHRAQGKLSAQKIHKPGNPVSLWVWHLLHHLPLSLLGSAPEMLGWEDPNTLSLHCSLPCYPLFCRFHGKQIFCKYTFYVHFLKQSTEQWNISRFFNPTDYTHVLASSVSDQEPGPMEIGSVMMSNILSQCFHHCISAHIWKETLEIPSQRTGNLGHLAPSSYFPGPGLGRRLAEVQVQMLQRPIFPCLPPPSLLMSHAAEAAFIFREEEFAPLTCFFKVWGELAARLLIALPVAPGFLSLPESSFF